MLASGYYIDSYSHRRHYGRRQDCFVVSNVTFCLAINEYCSNYGSHRGLRNRYEEIPYRSPIDLDGHYLFIFLRVLANRARCQSLPGSLEALFNTSAGIFLSLGIQSCSFKAQGFLIAFFMLSFFSAIAIKNYTDSSQRTARRPTVPALVSRARL